MFLRRCAAAAVTCRAAVPAPEHTVGRRGLVLLFRAHHQQVSYISIIQAQRGSSPLTGGHTLTGWIATRRISPPSPVPGGR